MEVDPTAPKLPASALVGLSPYFGLLQVDPSGRAMVPIFDLRTGKKLALALPAPPQPTASIAGHFAAWYTEGGDVYLANLDTGQVHKILSLPNERNYPSAVSLGDEWLVALQPSATPGPSSSTTQLSQHTGADLVALHLPDLRRVDIPGVVAQGEVGDVQVSGDTVLLTVSPAVEPIPHNEPSWTALRVLRLQ